MDLIKEFIQTANHQNSLGEKEKKKKKKVEDVDHVVIRQANKLLWQLGKSFHLKVNQLLIFHSRTLQFTSIKI